MVDDVGAEGFIEAPPAEEARGEAGGGVEVVVDLPAVEEAVAVGVVGNGRRAALAFDEVGEAVAVGVAGGIGGIVGVEAVLDLPGVGHAVGVGVGGLRPDAEDDEGRGDEEQEGDEGLEQAEGGGTAVGAGWRGLGGAKVCFHGGCLAYVGFNRRFVDCAR